MGSFRARFEDPDARGGLQELLPAHDAHGGHAEGRLRGRGAHREALLRRAPQGPGPRAVVWRSFGAVLGSTFFAIFQKAT